MAEAQPLHLELDLPEGIVKLDLQVSPGPQKLSRLTLDLLGFCDTVVRMGTEIAVKLGRTVTCGKGCGVCCRQLVPLSASEAVMIADVVDELPWQERGRALDAFALARERLHEAGLAEKIASLYGRRASEEEVKTTNREYFDLGIPCPFLVEGSCSIYPSRPSRCREYSVMSPAEYCANLFDARIRRLPVTMKLSEALAFAWASLTHTAPTLVPMVDALDWVEGNKDVRGLSVEGADRLISAVLNYACDAANRRARRNEEAAPTAPGQTGATGRL
jgi:Fe-S-cluster containining protein